MLSALEIRRPAPEPSLASRRAMAVAAGATTVTPVFAVRAEGEYIWDVEGRRYIDFASGSLEHRHPQILAAVRGQLDLLVQPAFQVMAYEPYIELAEALNELAPFSEPAKTVLLTTGAEAVEAAVKIARVATGRQAVIAFSGAVHGRTLLGATLTGLSSPYKLGMSSFCSDVVRIPFPVPQYGVRVEDTLRALDTCFRSDVHSRSVAAILIEPVQGEGGLHVAPPELLRALRQICNEHEIVLICDEVQSGCARTGRMFAIEHSGVEPDLVVLGKSLAGGFPLSAVVGRRDRLMDCPRPGGLGGTFGGSAVGCAAALAMLEIISQQPFLERVREVGTRIRARLYELAARKDLIPIANIRGLGAMLGFDIVKSRDSLEPDGATARRVIARALQLGLIILPSGPLGETLRLLPPLTLTDGCLETALNMVEKALERLVSVKSP